MKIKRFKQWYQVTLNGYTIAQFLTKHEAQAYIDIAAPRDMCLQRVNQHFGQTTRRISVYP